MYLTHTMNRQVIVIFTALDNYYFVALYRYVCGILHWTSNHWWRCICWNSFFLANILSITTICQLGSFFFSWHLIHYNSVSTGILFSRWHLIHYDSVPAGMYLFFSWHLIHYNSVSAVILFFNSHLINFNSVSAGVVLCSLLILSCHFKFTTDMKTPQRIITRNIHVMFNFYFVKRIKKKTREPCSWFVSTI